MASEAVSGRSRGRPPVFATNVLRQAAGFSYARTVRSRRGAQDLVYRMFALATIEHYCEAFPEKGEPLRWLLTPRRRHTLLTELGRVAHPRTDANGRLVWSEEGVVRLVEAAFVIAEAKPSTKAGVVMLRELRLGPRIGERPAR